jgi:DNA polymerase I-like protein with 3'-5' exonuclease and polymerase domains
MTRQELDDAVMAMIATNDVHLFRAALENGVNPAEVTPEQRQAAKNNNFRLLYSGGTQRFTRPEKLL